jgi:hypothetical protein
MCLFVCLYRHHKIGLVQVNVDNVSLLVGDPEMFVNANTLGPDTQLHHCKHHYLGSAYSYILSL